MSLRILQVCAIDDTAWTLLGPQMLAMKRHGWDVHVACTPGRRFPALEAQGIVTHAVSIPRNTNLREHLRVAMRLWRLMVRERYDVVHVHTPIAAAVGRVAAWLARMPNVVYTAHGFYFHDEMPAAQRRRHVWLEKALGRLTHHLMTQSAEDADTAVREAIMPSAAVTIIGNGVAIDRFRQVSAEDVKKWRERLGVHPGHIVVGIVGRLVAEKGFREFFDAARSLASQYSHVSFVVVGANVTGDRDPLGAEIDALLTASPLADRVFWTGYTDELPALMHLMDIFVLPSYREGMPRSIIEAMVAGKPVVATRIRGCREEVVEGETGFLVPTRDAKRLAERLSELVADEALRRRMGDAGRRRAEALFDERLVCERVVQAIEDTVNRQRRRT